jgi:endothelin-converting enzyme/putative endopeptidase
MKLALISTENIDGAIKTKKTPHEDRALQTVKWYDWRGFRKVACREMFPAEAKVKAEKMIKNIILAYQNRIKFNLMSW